jgi:hypothetical protein
MHVRCPAHLILLLPITIIKAYLVENANYEVSHYATFSVIPLLPPSKAMFAQVKLLEYMSLESNSSKGYD